LHLEHNWVESAIKLKVVDNQDSNKDSETQRARLLILINDIYIMQNHMQTRQFSHQETIYRVSQFNH